MSPSSTDPEINDLPVSVIAEDVVPTVDSAEPVATYKDWRPEDTRVVVYAVGNTYYPGIPAESRDAALAHAKLVYGRVLEENYVPGRAFFRVHKVKP